MKIKNNTGRERAKVVFFFTILIFTIACLFGFPRVALPLLVSYIITMILSPLMQKLIKIGLSRTLAAVSLLVGLIFFSTYPIVKIAPLVTKEAQNLQYYIPKVESLVKQNYYILKTKIRENTSFELHDKYITDGINFFKRGISSALLNLPNMLGTLLEWVFVVPLFVFFLLKDLPGFKKTLLRLTPNGIIEKFYLLSHQFNRQLGDYILAKFIEASILGVIITSGLLIIDVRFALIFGLVAVFTNVIPYLGPVLGTVPLLIFALAEYGFGPTFGAIAILCLIANIIDMAIVFPILVSKIVDLHPVVVVASVILGSQLLGIVGMIICIPVAAALKLIITEVFDDIYSSNSR